MAPNLFNFMKSTPAKTIVTNRYGVLKKYKRRNRILSFLSLRKCYPLLRLFSKPQLHDINYLVDTTKKLKIKKCAILVDNTSMHVKIPKSLNLEIIGCYSLDLRYIGKTFMNVIVKPLFYDKPLPDCDAWFVASSRPTAAYALNEILLRQGQQQQYIIRLVKTDSTKYYSYVDFFAGDTKTLIHVTNYFNRLYNITFPIDIRYTIRNVKGEIMTMGQRIIPSNGVTIINSEELNLGNFTGYIELEFELSWIEAKIQPFLHYWIDYINKDYISSTHQSGLKTTDSAFYLMRAYFPFRGDEHLIVSNLNNHHKDPVQPVAILEYTQDNKIKQVKRPMRPIPFKHVVFEDINDLFSDIPLSEIEARSFLVGFDKPIYRSNFYYSKGNHTGWINVGHLTRRLYNLNEHHMEYVTRYDKEDGEISEANTFTHDQLTALKKHGCIPWQTSFPILPKSLQIDTFLKFAGESTYEIGPNFRIVVYNENGRKVLDKKDVLNIHKFINLNDYIASQNIKLDSGVFQLILDDQSKNVPYESVFLVGLRHKVSDYMTTTNAVALITGFAINMPFYLNEKMPYSPNYDFSPFSSYDIFCRAICSDEFDTLLVLWNLSSYLEYKRPIHCRISLATPEGKEYSTTKRLSPNSLSIIYVSELIKEMNIDKIKKHFTVWLEGVDGQVLGFPILYRKPDHAINVEHFFRGRF